MLILITSSVLYTTIIKNTSLIQNNCNLTVVNYTDLPLNKLKSIILCRNLKLYQSIKYILYSYWIDKYLNSPKGNILAIGDISFLLLKYNLTNKFKIPTLFLKGRVEYIIDKSSEYYDVYSKYKFHCKKVHYVNFKNKNITQILKIISNVNAHK